MWAVWNMICDEDAPHTSFGDSTVGFYPINHGKSNVRVGRVQHFPDGAYNEFHYKPVLEIYNFLASVIQIDTPYQDEFSKILGGILANFQEPDASRRHELLSKDATELRVLKRKYERNAAEYNYKQFGNDFARTYTLGQ